MTDIDTTSSALATYDPNGGSQAVVIGQHVNQFIDFAKNLAASDLLPNGLRGKPANVFMALMQGLDLGLRPMQAIQLIDVIQGKPCLKAEGMRALITAAGHEIRVVEWTDEKCVIEGRRADTDEWRQASFSIAQAKSAGLAGDNWKKYPADMLLARATSRLSKAYFADVTNGLSSAEEMLDVVPQRTLADVAKDRQRTPAAEPDDVKLREEVLAAQAGVAGHAEAQIEDAVVVTKCEVCGGEGDHDLEIHQELGQPIQDTLS